jgi:arginine/ornithine N-succinyltransferase beta subunit
MLDKATIRARISLAEDYIRSQDYARAIKIFAPVIDCKSRAEVFTDESSDALFCECWLNTVYCHLMLGEEKDAYDRLIRDRDLLNKKSRKHFSMAIVLADSMNGGGVNRLRSEAEKFSQGMHNYGISILPTIFSRLEERIRQASDAASSLGHHDYSVTSYSLWQSGLNLMVKGEYVLAQADLQRSIDRYELAGMESDVLWSWFDAIVCHLFLDLSAEAKALYKKYFTRAISESPHFETAAREMLTAFAVGDLRAIQNARELIVHRWKGFGDSQYPVIFEKFKLYVEGRSAKIPAPSVMRKGEGKSRRCILLTRPAQPEDLESLLEIAKEVNLANTRADPEAILRQIDISEKTLANAVSWDQGLLLLSTRLYDHENQSCVVGNCKLQMMVDACWIKVPRQRVGRMPARPRFRVEYDVLRYSSSKSAAMELSGNAVLQKYWGLGIGKFQIQARLLFLLTHEIPSVACLEADLLTRSVRKTFPFYERVVRAMVGNLEYDDADVLRYTDIGFFESLLGPVGGEPAMHIPLHSLELEILEALGTVREQTKAVQAVLHSYGFRKSNKYDLLDGGQYYETGIDDFKRASFDRDLLARKATHVDEAWPMVATCPSKRPPAEFVALKCRANIDGNSLYLPENIFTYLDVEKDEEFKVLLDTEMPALQHKSQTQTMDVFG